MKHATTGFAIKCRLVRSVTNQVIALLIFHHPLDAAIQIVRVADGDPASLCGQIIKTFLHIESGVAAILQLLRYLVIRPGGVISGGVISGRQAESLQPSWV